MASNQTSTTAPASASVSPSHALATLEQDSESIGEELGKDLLSDGIGYITGAGWDTKIALPKDELFSFTISGLSGNKFNCQAGYKDGQFVFSGTPA
jgi:hypothetical protein